MLPPLTAIAQGGGVRASALLEKEVVDPQGEELGDVHELVIDMRSGGLHFVVLEMGGVLGLGGKLIPWPPSKLSPGRESDKLVLDVRPEALAEAAGFERDRWPPWTDPLWHRAERAASDPAATAGGSAFDSQEQFLRTGELIGRRMQDGDGNTVGKLEDLIVDLDAARVRAVVIQDNSGRRAQVAMARLHRQAGAPGQPFVLNLDRRELQWD